MIRSTTFLMLILPLAAAAQFSYVTDQSIPVSSLNGDVLTNAWGGGLNAAQYSTLDLDSDGHDDLVLFDRMANKVITYLRKDDSYIYAKDYEKFFPPTITNWLLLRDYNCDGKKDLFTGHTAGMTVFTNVTEPGNPPKWKQLYFYPDDTKTEAIYTKGFNGMVNLQTQYDDLPSVSDLDGDGDLDIVILRFPGGSTLEYHQNFSKERIGTCDSLIFERVSNTWGGFTECNCGSYAFNNTACPPSGGREKHAGGKSLLILDSDGDGDQDVLFSESSCTLLYTLNAQGNGPTASLLSFSTFPPVNPVNGVNFPSAYFEDVDADGVKDIVVSPNLYANDFPNSQPNLKQSNWFYKNMGTTAAPNFRFVTRNFLQDQMIEVGDNAAPAFADYDADGDLDMFIGQLTSTDVAAKIAQYENTGSASEPAFKLKTEDYLGISGLFLFNIKPQWVDITGDAKTDLVFTATSLQNGLTSLYYLANKSEGAFNFSSQILQTTGFGLIRTENVHVTDVDQNGSMDLLLGKSTGAIEYWKNTGKPGTFTYAKEAAPLLGLGTSFDRQNPSIATADLDGDGNDDLILGDQTGILKIVGDYRKATDASGAITDIVYYDLLPGENAVGSGYSTQNFGGRIRATAANLFNTDKPAIVVGNILGGVQVLRHDNGGSLTDEPTVKIWPVPVDRNESLKIKPDRPVLMEMYSALGQRVAEPVALNANVTYDLTVLPAASGMYILKFTANNKSFARRIVIY
jgi:hypothetical protein